MIISFAWTTDAILDRSKKVTRRDWSDDYAARFHAGDLIQGYDKSPRNGGVKISTCRITEDPYKELLGKMPEEDFELEGGLRYWTDLEDFINSNGGPAASKWVIRFEVVETFPENLKKGDK